MKPRVLMIAYACNPEGSGEHWLGWGWAEQAARQFQVHLLTTPRSQREVEEHSRRHGITPHFVGIPEWLKKVSPPSDGESNWLHKFVWQHRATRLVQALHQKEKFQIVHQTTFHTFRVPLVGARLGIPAVWGPIAGGESVPPGFGRYLGPARLKEFLRGLVNPLWLALPSVRNSLRRAGVIFVSNRTTLQFLPAWVRDKCVVVPPNALRAEAAAGSVGLPASPGPAAGGVQPPGGGSADTVQLLYVGNCVATRALPLVFEALRHSGLENWKLTVVGTGPALEWWRRLVDQLGLSAKVEFTGQLPREKLPACYQQADAFVFPALRDSGGSSLLEAMERGVPVICLDWGGPGEMVDAGSGIKIPVRDREETVAALAAAIVRLKALPGLRTSLARAGVERAQKHFCWATKGALLVSTYQRLLLGK